MMIKYAKYSGTDILEVVEPGTKVASGQPWSAARQFIGRLEPDPRYTYALVNAMGYSEFFGANSNTDWYGYNQPLDFNGLLHAWDGIGNDVEVDRMRAKQWAYGYPTFYNAACFAHHKNTDPQALGFGDVIFVAANPHMKRLELVMRVFNEEAKKKGHTNFLDRMRAGERVDVSQGCKVPFDLCSICTDWSTVHKAWGTFDPKRHLHPGIAVLTYHKTVAPIRGLAITSKDYCEHMKLMRGKTLPDGRKVFVYNDFPRFFDISFVWVGADRTARAMWFLSPEGSTVSNAPPPSANNLDQLFSRFFSSRPKIASLEKRIPDGFVEAVQQEADAAPAIDGRALRAVAKQHGPNTLLSSLASLGIVLRPDEFQHVALANDDKDAALADFFEKRSLVFPETAGVSDRLKVSSNFSSLELIHKLAGFAPARSGYDPFLMQRVERAKVAARQSVRTDSTDLPKLASIGDEYNGYRLSLLESAEELHGQGVLGLPDFMSKTSSLGGLGAGLLLGAGPVIHFLSAHLRSKEPELGGVGKFIANNPTFTTLVTIGALLRTAMAVTKAGGFGAVVRAFGQAALKAL